MSFTTLAAAGAISSAVGAYSSAKGQKIALEGQANLDKINAQARAQASSTQAELDLADAKGNSYTLNAQAEVSDLNARLLDLSAEDALLAGQHEEQRARLATARIKSAQKVAIAANGIDMAEGTPIELLTGTDLMGEIDAQTIKANAARSAFGYRTQAVNARGDATLRKAQAGALLTNAEAATNARKTGVTGQLANDLAAADTKRAGAAGINPAVAGMNSLISNGTQVAASWYRYNKAKG
jgi:hypothetical protein